MLVTLLIIGVSVLATATVAHILNSNEKEELRKSAKIAADGQRKATEDLKKAFDYQKKADLTLLKTVLENINLYINTALVTGRIKNPDKYLLLSAGLHYVIDAQKDLDKKGTLTATQKNNINIIKSINDGASMLSDNREFLDDLLLKYRSKVMSSFLLFLDSTIDSRNKRVSVINSEISKIAYREARLKVELDTKNSYPQKEYDECVKSHNEFMNELNRIEEGIERLSFLRTIIYILATDKENTPQITRAIDIVLRLSRHETLSSDDQRFVHAFKLKYDRR
ncbi:MAG: hypothetical protein LAT81_16770 [Oceanicaulis sp.]|nr:hypothetical protein [Oceanicaulis sp.]